MQNARDLLVAPSSKPQAPRQVQAAGEPQDAEAEALDDASLSDYEYWDKVAKARETYRAKLRLFFSGDEVTLQPDALAGFLKKLWIPDDFAGRHDPLPWLPRPHLFRRLRAALASPSPPATPAATVPSTDALASSSRFSQKKIAPSSPTENAPRNMPGAR